MNLSTFKSESNPFPSDALKHVALEKQKLETYVQTVNQKVSSLLERQLVQFIQAQRAVFNRIHHETQKYLEKIAQQEDTIRKLTNQGDIAKLLQEKKALEKKLYSTTQKLVTRNTDYQSLKQKYDILDHENKRLQQNCKELHRQAISKKSSQPNITHLSTQDNNHFLKNQDTQQMLNDKQSTAFLTSQNNNESLAVILPSGGSIHKEQELDSYRWKCTHLEKEVATLKQKYKRVLSSSMAYVDKSDYEAFFISCIDKFKTKKKKSALGHTRYNSNQMRNASPKEQRVLQTDINLSSKLNSHKEDDLKNLTLAERQEIFNYILQNDNLIADLYHLLFGKPITGKPNNDILGGYNVLKVDNILNNGGRTVRMTDLPKLDTKMVFRQPSNNNNK